MRRAQTEAPRAAGRGLVTPAGAPRRTPWPRPERGISDDPLALPRRSRLHRADQVPPHRGGARLALSLFALQLALNAAWSWIFFGLHRIGFGLADLLLLLVVLLATTAAFFRHDRVAGALLVPYVAWASFATALNAAFWTLN